LFAQAVGTLALALALALLPGDPVAALQGGAICLLGHAWGAWQLRPRPGPVDAQRVLARVVRAEMGKVAIFLVLFALSFRFEPRMHQAEGVVSLIAGFAGAHLFGWLNLARGGGDEGTGDDAGNQDRE
jgi:F0F1-type ATP synthase assembly protein I